jgi:hypothetical protein
VIDSVDPQERESVEELKVRNSFRIKRYNLAVEKQCLIPKLTYCRGNLTIISDVRSARSTQVQIEVRFLVFADDKS